MKKIFFISAILFSIAASAQNHYNIGIDTLNGRIGYKFLERPLYTAGSISKLNDSTIFGAGGSGNTGWTFHGISGTGSNNDTILYKDTAKTWLAINKTSPQGLFDIYATPIGTVSVTNGSATVTGTGTLFLSYFKPLDTIQVNATTNAVVLSIASNTSLTLAANYTGSTASGQSYINLGASRGIIRFDGNNKWYQNGLLLSNNSLLGANTSFGQSSLLSLAPTNTTNTGNNNSAFGNSALKSLTTGRVNNAFGASALMAATTGAGNDAFGYQSQMSATTAQYNVSFGYQSSLNNVSGQENAAFGLWALKSNTGSYNTALGSQSTMANTSGQFNSAVGYQSLYTNTTGSNNTAIGTQSLYTNTTGSNNTALGTYALNSSIVSDNVAIGYQAMRYTGNNNYCAAVGSLALLRNNASGIVAVGYATLGNNSTGSGLVAVGYSALVGNQTGNYNTAVGYSSTVNNRAGNGNTTLGYNSNDARTSATSITITNGGSGYATAPSVSVLNVLGFSGTVNISGGVVISVTIIDGGIWNGASPLTVTFTGGGGSGATATAVLSTGSRNTAVGYQAGLKAGYGSANVYLGYDVEGVQNDSNKLFIDNSDLGTGSLIYGDFLNRTVKVNGKLNMSTGSNLSIGKSSAMSSGTITISTTAVTSSSIIFLTHAGGGTSANFGVLSVGTITNGTSFVINSSNVLDNDTVNWWIIN